LGEFPYEDWLWQKRDYLRRIFFRGTIKYATLELDSGNPYEARRVLEEALFKDLSHSDCMTLLIQVLTKMKLYHEIKEWSKRYMKYMKEILDLEPTREVVDILRYVK
jgi:two-component SAPR family response regulator